MNKTRRKFLNTKPRDIHILKSLFTEFKNKVSIKVPIKGKKKMLLKMVEENVDASLEKKTKDRLETKSILVSLKNKLKLKNIPNRIEIYDNSHLNGTNPVGVMVVYENGSFVKKGYRKFNILVPNDNSSDDYFMMNQVMERRFKISTDWKKKIPDLILIDGGKGQVNIVNKVLCKKKVFGIDLIGIAKGRNRNAGDEKIYYNNNLFELEKNNKVLFFLQRLRDEAHRFAVNSSKIKHNKSLRNSIFDNIVGIGRKTKLILLSYFGTIENIKTAGISDLKKVPNIGTKTAEKIYKEFNKNV